MKARFGNRDILLLLSAAALCASLLGCETNVVRQGPLPGDPGPGNQSTPAQSPPAKLVNEPGANATVWIDAGGVGERYGFILYSAGNKVEFINDAQYDIGGLVPAVAGVGKWEYKNEALYFTNVTGCTAGTKPCQYAVTSWIRSPDNDNYETKLDLALGYEVVEGGRTRTYNDEIRFYKMSVARLQAGYLEKRPAEDRVKSADRYVSLVE
jgi:hypothetical protein